MDKTERKDTTIMTNNPYLQIMYEMEMTAHNIGERFPNVVDDSVLQKVEDRLPVSEEDWTRAVLQVALIRSALHRFEQALLAARSEPHLEWSFDEADRLAHPEAVGQDWK